MSKLSPIVLFVYKRPLHTEKTLQSLSANKLSSESELFIYSDGPRDNNDLEEVRLITEVREVIRKDYNFKTVQIIERKKNMGLADSIITGVTEIVDHYGKVIVMESDLETSEYFLTYMNDALSLYEQDESVMHISAYILPLRKKLAETFFYNNTTCWGWATWKRAWRYFEPDPLKLYDELKEKNLISKLNIDGAEPDMEKQLVRNIEGKIKTWAIKWNASVLLRGGLCLHPNKSFVNNIGLDSSGTHPQTRYDLTWKHLSDQIKLEKNALIESLEAREAVASFYKNTYYNNDLKTRIVRKLQYYKAKMKDGLRLLFLLIFLEVSQIFKSLNADS